jgi:hypothetical protein
LIREEEAEYNRRKSEWEIFSFETVRQRKRREREDDAKARQTDGEFDPLSIGHLYADQVLPAELTESYLVWRLADENIDAYFFITRTFTLLEVQEALAMKLTSQYLEEEEDVDSDSPDFG